MVKRYLFLEDSLLHGRENEQDIIVILPKIGGNHARWFFVYSGNCFCNSAMTEYIKQCYGIIRINCFVK